MANSSKKPLTFQAIKNMKANTWLSDANENIGLRVRKGSTGKTTFYYRYRDPSDSSKLIQMVIGHFPSMDLSTARLRLHELKLIRIEGRCPKTDRKQREELLIKQKKDDSESFTVREMVDLYLNQYIDDRYSSENKLIKGARKPKGQKEVRRILYKDVVQNIGDKIASILNRQDVIDLILSISGRGANVQAGNVLRELNAAYEFSIGLGKLEDDFTNPVILAKNSLAMMKVKLTSNKGKRVLSDAELKELLSWMPNSKLPDKSKNILMLTLYTGCRTGEWCNAMWNDIDFENRTFHIREAKNGSERYVQLSSYAIEILIKIKLKNKSQYLFTSSKINEPLQQHKLSEYNWVLRKKNEMIDIPRWTPHDLRRTVRTGLSRLQCPSEVAEAILGHSRKGIEGTYDLHSYASESKKWLQAWGDHINSLVNK